MTFNYPNLKRGQDFLWREIIFNTKKRKLAMPKLMFDDPSSIRRTEMT